MLLTHVHLRKLFIDFWKDRDHKESPPIPLVPQNDPTTLFTGSGMQPLVPYLLGEPHPQGNKLYNIQPCFRSQDIDEVGDNRHTTFFEMMGNWSLGDYFKNEQLTWFWQFLTEEVKLPKEKLYVTVFAGDKKNNLPPDTESIEIYRKLGVSENNIFKYGPEKNWWSRAGIPDNMPAGEPGGPDSEVFYEFTQIPHTPQNPDNPQCHPNCDCGRFMEIGNSVFMEYKKNKDGIFSELPKKNVDFGGGMERILAVANNNPDVFMTSLYQPIISAVGKVSNKTYSDEVDKQKIRIIADHLKAASSLINIDVVPSNKERGYFLRRLLRRISVKMLQLKGETIQAKDLIPAVKSIIDIYKDVYFVDSDIKKIQPVIEEEINRFNKTLKNGLKILEKTFDKPTGKQVFDLYQSYGFPMELTQELLKEKGFNINKQEFEKEFEKHKNLSRTSSSSMFKGGLADHNEKTLKYHTTTHLLHQALFDVMGESIRQEGSNITGERLRFDFYSISKPSPEQIKKIEKIINDKIKEKIAVDFKIIPKKEALKLGAKSFFREKYPDMVKVYFVGNYSKEFCGGPHVKNTSEIGKIQIYKFEKIGSNLYRIYAKGSFVNNL
jgi:alanyl-tRNA synthetase